MACLNGFPEISAEIIRRFRSEAENRRLCMACLRSTLLMMAAVAHELSERGEGDLDDFVERARRVYPGGMAFIADDMPNELIEALLAPPLRTT